MKTTPVSPSLLAERGLNKRPVEPCRFFAWVSSLNRLTHSILNFRERAFFAFFAGYGRYLRLKANIDCDSRWLGDQNHSSQHRSPLYWL